MEFKKNDFVREKVSGFVDMVVFDTYPLWASNHPSITHGMKRVYETKGLEKWSPEEGETVVSLQDRIPTIIEYNGEDDVVPFIGVNTWSLSD